MTEKEKLEEEVEILRLKLEKADLLDKLYVKDGNLLHRVKCDRCGWSIAVNIPRYKERV